MMLSNMKYKPTSTHWYRRLYSVWPEVVLGLMGMYICGVTGGIFGAALGFAVAAVMQMAEKRAASELEWSDIEIAVQNYASYYFGGFDRIEFTIHGRGAKSFFCGSGHFHLLVVPDDILPEILVSA